MTANEHPFRDQVYPLARLLDDRHEAAPVSLSGIQRDFLLAHWFLIDVELNGFRSFIENPRGGPDLDLLPGALERIGADATAAAARRVVDVLPADCRSEDAQVRSAAVEALDARCLRLIDELEAVVDRRVDDLLLLQCDFAQEHERELRAPGPTPPLGSSSY